MRSTRLIATLSALLITGLLAPRLVSAQSLAVSVQDAKGNVIEDAVVYALPLTRDGQVAPSAQKAVIDQVDKEYVPRVTAVRAGTQINFPNRDQIRHHVYSFSDAKTFEIPLYKGTPPAPVLFDKPGVVSLGCNIHDWMKAYVFVTETPHFAVTGADGQATLSGIPARSYRVQVWHPRLKGSTEGTAQEIRVGGAGESVSFVIEQKRVWRPRRAPSAGGAGYN